MVNKKILRSVLLLILISVLVSSLAQAQLLNRGLNSIENFFRGGYTRYTKILDFSALFLILTAAFLIALRQIKVPGGKDGKETNNRPIKVLAVVLALTSALGIVTTTKFSIFTYPQIWAALAFIVLVWIIYTLLLKIGMEKHKFWAFILALIIATLLVFLIDWWSGGRLIGFGRGGGFGFGPFGGGGFRFGGIDIGKPRIGPIGVPHPTPDEDKKIPDVPDEKKEDKKADTGSSGGWFSWMPGWGKWGLGGAAIALALYFLLRRRLPRWIAARRARRGQPPGPAPTPPLTPLQTFVQNLPTQPPNSLNAIVRRIYENAMALLGSTGTAGVRRLRLTIVQRVTLIPLNQATVTLDDGTQTQTFQSGTTNSIDFDLDRQTTVENRNYALGCTRQFYSPFRHDPFNPHAQQAFTIELDPMDILLIKQAIDNYNATGRLESPDGYTVNLHDLNPDIDNVTLRDSFITFRIQVGTHANIVVKYHEDGTISIGGTLLGTAYPEMNATTINAAFIGLTGLQNLLQWIFENIHHNMPIPFHIFVFKAGTRTDPIEDAEIEIIETLAGNTRRTVATVRTDGVGHVEVPLQRKEYQVVLKKDGYTLQSGRIDVRTTDRAVFWLVRVAEARQRVSFKIKNTRGDPIPDTFGAKLNAGNYYARTILTSDSRMTHADANGIITFDFGNKLYDVVFLARGYKRKIIRIDGTIPLASEIDVTLEDDTGENGNGDPDHDDGTTRTRFTATVLDQHTEQPIPDAFVIVEDHATSSRTPPKLTRADGCANFNLPPKEYLFHVGKHGSPYERIAVPVNTTNKDSHTFYLHININVNQNCNNYDPNDIKNFKLIVRYASGTPASRMRVHFVAQGKVNNAAKLNKKGNENPPGVYSADLPKTIFCYRIIYNPTISGKIGEKAGYIDTTLQDQDICTLDFDPSPHPEEPEQPKPKKLKRIEVDCDREAVPEFFVQFLKNMDPGTVTAAQVIQNTEPGVLEIEIPDSIMYIRVTAQGCEPGTYTHHPEDTTILIHLSKEDEKPKDKDDDKRKKTSPPALLNEFYIVVKDAENDRPLQDAVCTLEFLGKNVGEFRTTGEGIATIVDRYRYDKEYTLIVSKEGYIDGQSIIRPLRELSPHEVYLIPLGDEGKPLPHVPKPSIPAVLLSERIEFKTVISGTDTPLQGVDVKLAVNNDFKGRSDKDGRVFARLPRGDNLSVLFSCTNFETTSWSGKIPTTEKQPIRIELTPVKEEPPTPPPPSPPPQPPTPPPTGDTVTFIVKNQKDEVQENVDIKENTITSKAITKTDSNGIAVVTPQSGTTMYYFNKKGVGSAKYGIDRDNLPTEAVVIILMPKGEEPPAQISLVPITSQNQKGGRHRILRLATPDTSHGFQLNKASQGSLNLGWRMILRDPQGKSINLAWKLKQSFYGLKNTEAITSLEKYHKLDAKKVQKDGIIGAVLDTFVVPADAQVGQYKLVCEICNWSDQTKTIASDFIIIDVKGLHYDLSTNPELSTLKKRKKNVSWITIKNISDELIKQVYDYFVLFVQESSIEKGKGTVSKFCEVALPNSVKPTKTQIKQNGLEEAVKKYVIVKVARGTVQKIPLTFNFKDNAPNTAYQFAIHMSILDPVKKEPMWGKEVTPAEGAAKLSLQKQAFLNFKLEAKQ